MTEVTEPTKRFSGLAQSYSAGRPSYSAEVIDFIVEHCKLSSASTIADIGCGTGISSRLFAERNIKVTGVEPNDDMIRQARSEANKDGSRAPEYIRADAENTGLPDQSFDLVLAAQAFHWFRPDEAIAEFCRILRKKGWIALIWNERDAKDPFTDEYGKLLHSFPETAKVEMHRRMAGQPLIDSSRVSSSSLTWFHNDQKMDLPGFRQRAFSTSYSPKQSPDKEVFIDGLQKLFEKHQSGGNVIMHYETSVYLAQSP